MNLLRDDHFRRLSMFVEHSSHANGVLNVCYEQNKNRLKCSRFYFQWSWALSQLPQCKPHHSWLRRQQTVRPVLCVCIFFASVLLASYYNSDGARFNEHLHTICCKSRKRAHNFTAMFRSRGRVSLASVRQLFVAAIVEVFWPCYMLVFQAVRNARKKLVRSDWLVSRP